MFIIMLVCISLEKKERGGIRMVVMAGVAIYEGVLYIEIDKT